MLLTAPVHVRSSGRSQTWSVEVNADFGFRTPSMEATFVSKLVATRVHKNRRHTFWRQNRPCATKNGMPDFTLH